MNKFKYHQQILANHLAKIASGIPYEEYLTHDFSKVTDKEKHKTEIINKDGVPYCTCDCGYVCDLEGDGTGIIIHKMK